MGFLRGVPRRLAELLHSAGGAGAAIAVVALAGVVLVTLAEVVIRGVFGKAFTDVVTLGRIAMILMGFLVAAHAQRHRRHVSISFVLDMLPPVLALRLRTLGLLIGVAALATTTVLTFQFSEFTRHLGTLLLSDWELPAWLFQVVIPIGLALLTLELMVQVVGYLPAAWHGRPLDEAANPGLHGER